MEKETQYSRMELNFPKDSDPQETIRLNILRDVSVRIAKISDSDLSEWRGRDKERLAKIETPATSTLKQGLSDGLQKHDELVGKPFENNGTCYADSKITNLKDSDHHENNSRITDFGGTVRKNMSKTLLNNESISYISINNETQHSDLPQIDTRVKEKEENVVKEIPRIITCQIASPDLGQATIGWSPPYNSTSVETLTDGAWILTTPVIQQKSRSMCPMCPNLSSSLKSSNSYANEPYDSDNSLLPVEYKFLDNAASISSLDSNDECMVEYKLSDTSISNNEISIAEKKMKISFLSKKSNMMITKGKKRNDFKSRLSHRKIAKDFIQDDSSETSGQPIPKTGNKIPKSKISFMEGLRLNESSSSENEEEIDAEEMKTLKSKIRRSNRVAKPVYDPFVDKQVSNYLNQVP